ncbi:MAG TPA: ester cyclase [Acidimicrobiales bacterium]|nr:ester cyclase [Acidimicrobiales bacterium]
METDLLDAWLSAWNSHDGGKLAALMADDGSYEVLATSRFLHKRSSVAKFVDTRLSFSSDFSVKYVSTQRDGDRYATEWEMTGTADQPVAGWPATGKPWRIRGASIGLSEGGKIKLHREYWDLSAVVAQLGLPPSSEVDWILQRMSEEL